MGVASLPYYAQYQICAAHLSRSCALKTISPSPWTGGRRNTFWKLKVKGAPEATPSTISISLIFVNVVIRGSG